MNILHYNLGLPPYRSGGLTAWSMDLIEHQISQGAQVSILFPGEIKLIQKRMKVERSNSYKKAEVFRLVNPLPVPLIYAIDSVRHYLNYPKDTDFTPFFVKNKIDVIHLHTLMGLPIEFLEQAKENNIKLIYTAHDTFGVWPEPRLNANDINTDPIFNIGYIGNQRKLSYISIVIMQSLLYRSLKDTKVMRLVKSRANRIRASINGVKPSGSVNVHDLKYDLKDQQLYDQMRKHYKNYFDFIDTIHHNSNLTEDIFDAYGINRPSVVIPVYHSYLPIKSTKPEAAESDIKNGNIKILYNGTREQYKGYDFLLEVLDELQNEGINNFEVIMHGSGVPSRLYTKLLPAYNISDLDTVYSGIDVTVVPSLYYETFGMVVAESLSFDVPVILSKNVGSKSLIKGHNYGYEFQTKQDFKKYLESILLNPEIIASQKRAILVSKELKFDSGAVYAAVFGLYSKGVHE